MTERRVIGVDPDLTEAQFTQILREAGSPALSAAGAVYRYCVQRKVSSAFLLAMFLHESGLGKNGWAAKTKSWGNTRLPAIGPEPTMVYDQDKGTGYHYWGSRPTAGRYLCGYKDWIDGGISTVARLTDHAPYMGKTTVEAIIPIWAPSSDGNDTARYVAAVLASMDEWTKGQAPTMVTRPPVNTSHPSPNRNGYGGTRRADAIVWHVTVGGLEGTLSWLTSPASAASANYVIARNGAIYELVPPNQDAWANGAVKSPDLSNPVIAGWIAENVNVNQRTISVEHERLTSANEQPGGFTEAQHRSTVALAAWLCQEFGIAPDRTHIIRHAQIDSVNRAHCPGLAESEMLRWIDEVAALVNDPPPPVPDPGSIRTYINAAGQTIVELNFGGTATAIAGTAFAGDVGVSVIGGGGVTYHRTLRDGVFLDWHE